MYTKCILPRSVSIDKDLGPGPGAPRRAQGVTQAQLAARPLEPSGTPPMLPRPLRRPSLPTENDVIMSLPALST